ncbi:MAG: hypothetical protein ABIO92_08440 [Chloroflexia bacterium]
MISPSAYPTAYPPPATDPIISRLRPRTVMEVLDHAFRLYRRHFLTFLAIIAVVHVPLQLLIQGANIWLLAGYTDILADSGSGSLGSGFTGEMFGTIIAVYLIVIALAFLYSILLFLSQGALTAAIANSHTDKPVGFGRAYKSMLGHVWPLLGWMALQTLIYIGMFVPVVLVFALAAVGAAATGSDGAGLGFAAICFSCFLIIPTLMFMAYVFVRLSAVVPAIVVENLGPVEAMRRSWRLVQNYWWRTLALLAVLWVMSLVVAAGPAAVIIGIVGLVTRSFDQVMINAVNGVVTVITTAFFVPLQLAAMTLYYFDLRVRKEGFDLDAAMTQRYGQPGVPQPGFGGVQATPLGAYGQAQAGGMGAPVLGYQQPSDTRYIGGYTPPPVSAYTPPQQEEVVPESYTTEQVTPPTDIYAPPESSQEEQGSATRSMFEQEVPPDKTPRQG